MGALINNLNKQPFTMTKNRLKLNFYGRFSEYLEPKTGETKKRRPKCFREQKE